MFGSSTSRNAAQSSGFKLRCVSAANEMSVARATTAKNAPEMIRRIFGLPPAPAERITAMCPATADGPLAALARFGFEKRGVEIWKAFQFQPRNFLAHETLDRVQRSQLLAVHQSKRVADILRAARPADSVHVIFRVL